MSQSPKYYTDDITRMPSRVIWRHIPNTPSLSSILAFLYLRLRKLLGLRFPANYGSMRPDILPKVRPESVPDDVLNEMTPYVEACQAAGFSVVTWLRSNIIGHKQTYSILLLHESGQVSALATWLRTSRGPEVKQRIVFGCHSFDLSSVQISTTPVAERDRIIELLPPNNDMYFLPIDTLPNATIKAHFERIAGRNDLVRFDADSLERQLLRETRALYDHLIAMRIYVPITPSEVERLSAVSDIVEAKLA